MPGFGVSVDLLPCIAPTTVAAFTFIYKLCRLLFIRHVYNVGGAKDVKIVATALKFDFRPPRTPPDKSVDDKDDDDPARPPDTG